jgi:hypothetical protein
MNSLSSYISGRTPGGGGRGGNNSQQSQQQQQQHDSRNNRGGGSISNGRGGSRGRGNEIFEIHFLVLENFFFLKVGVILLLDQLVEILILKIMERMEEVVVVMIHLHHHHHGLAVVILRVVVDLLEIECDLTMIGEH